jgi:predicted O-methyltransferase YrrM
MKLDNIITKLKIYASENKTPIMTDGAMSILLDKFKEINPKRILEIGTAIGYSGLMMLTACPESYLVTVEIDARSAEVARQTFKSAGLTERVQLIEGDINEVIKYIGGGFDFILLDGPKGHYEQLRSYLVNLLADGGILFADNVLFKGYVNSGYTEHKHRTAVASLESFIRNMMSDGEFVSELIDVDDGILVSRKSSYL